MRVLLTVVLSLCGWSCTPKSISSADVLSAITPTATAPINLSTPTTQAADISSALTKAQLSASRAKTETEEAKGVAVRQVATITALRSVLRNAAIPLQARLDEATRYAATLEREISERNAIDVKRQKTISDLASSLTIAEEHVKSLHLSLSTATAAESKQAAELAWYRKHYDLAVSVARQKEVSEAKAVSDSATYKSYYDQRVGRQIKTIAYTSLVSIILCLCLFGWFYFSGGGWVMSVKGRMLSNS